MILIKVLWEIVFSLMINCGLFSVFVPDFHVISYMCEPYIYIRVLHRAYEDRLVPDRQEERLWYRNHMFKRVMDTWEEHK